MQRLDPLRPLPFAHPHAIFTRDLEKRRGRLDQPLRFDGRDVVHVLSRRLDQTVIDDVFGGFAEQRRRRMHVHGRALDEGFETFLGIFARGVAEETGAERLSDAGRVATTR